MLIKHFAEEVEKPYSEGGRRTIFLANNVPLVIQQAEFIRSHTYLNVGEYYGDKLIGNKLLDSWDKETWTKELEKNHILAMSPQIFIDMLNHSFISIKICFILLYLSLSILICLFVQGMSQINLIIFDECHHATGNHPYSQIMNKYYTENAIDLNVRVLGLTASIVHRKCNLKTFNSCLKKLEDKFGLVYIFFSCLLFAFR
jgi:endoribonuclease Dicer